MNIEEEKRANADKCIQKAEEAYNNNKYDKAESLLLKAERFYPTQLAKQMLEDVRAAKNRNNTSNDIQNSENRGPDAADEEYKYHRTEADQRYAKYCILIAKVDMSKGNYERAQSFIMKSNRLYPSAEADSLLKQVKELKLKAGSSNYCRNKTDGCKEDSEKCIEVAQDEFAAGNLARAERLLLKAERFYTTVRAKDLLKQIETARAAGRPDVGQPVEAPRRLPPKEEQPKPKPKPKGPTPEQVEAVRRVKEATDDYAMFDMTKDSAPEAIRKAYKVLAAQLHPDKNKAEGSREAFMLMRDAFDRIKIKKSIK